MTALLSCPPLPAPASPQLVTRAIPDHRPDAIRWPGPDQRPPGMAVLPLTDDGSPGRPAAARTDPAVEAFGHTLVAALLDVIQGRRPSTQLIRWVSDDVLAELVLRTRLHQRSPVALAVRSVRLQQVSDSAVELSTRIQAGDRHTAVALRIERLGRRWICRVADFGPLPTPVEPLTFLRERTSIGQRRE